MTTAPKFVETIPPGKPGRPPVWQETFEALKSRPGEWAIVAEDCDYKDAMRAAKALARWGAQISQRKNGDAFTIYARFRDE